MLAHARTRAAVVARRTAVPRYRWGSLSALMSVALLAAACAPAPPVPLAGPDPADPYARVPGVAYRSSVAPYVSRRPVEPSAWQDPDDRTAPAPQP
jgi:hypothetical protein